MSSRIGWLVLGLAISGCATTCPQAARGTASTELFESSAGPSRAVRARMAVPSGPARVLRGGLAPEPARSPPGVVAGPLQPRPLPGAPRGPTPAIAPGLAPFSPEPLHVPGVPDVPGPGPNVPHNPIPSGAGFNPLPGSSAPGGSPLPGPGGFPGSLP